MAEQTGAGRAYPGMTITDAVPASHHDLLDAAGTAALVTLDSHGRPQTTAVWYAVDGEGRLTTSITDQRQKYKNLVANPEVDLFVIDPTNPFHTLEIRGTVELVADPEHTGLATVAEKYATPVADLIAYGGNRYTVLITPRRVVTNG
jgi:PPOX class probable F420-dependent enzyme